MTHYSNENIGESLDQPVANARRYASLDILRGAAVLAIFVVNIKGMLAPFSWYGNASLWPGQWDMSIATLQAFLIDDKWRTIFTALFGAGLILIAEKTAAAGGNPIKRMATRNGWLLAFGLFHLMFIWMGDILTAYALTGFVAMTFWNKSVKSLTVWAISILIVAYFWMSLVNLAPFFSEQARAQMKPIMWVPDAKELQLMYELYFDSSVLEQVIKRSGDAVMFLLFFVIAGGFGAATLGVMLMGMVLWKTGFLKGELTTKTYLKYAVIGLSIAVVTDAGRWIALMRTDWAFDTFVLGNLTNYFNGLAGGFGFASLLMAIVRSGATLAPLAAVGRMAFTNYILCSLIGTTLAFDHGAGLFMKLTLAQLMGIVAVTWLGLMVFSMLWLSIFRFGPLEWLWRSLSYGQLQPVFRRR